MPAKLTSGFAHQLITLSVGDQLGRQQSLTQVFQERLAIAFKLNGGTVQDLRRRDTLVFLGRQTASKYRFTDQRQRNTHAQGDKASPPTGTFLASFVQNPHHQQSPLFV